MAPLVLQERSVTFRSQGTVELKPPTVNAANASLPNKVCTTRFTLLTWLPLSLWVQFQRVANQFFFIVSILVCLPFSPVQPSTTAGPFAGVLLWTACKDLYEDRKRQRDDDAVNMKSCLRFEVNSGQFKQTEWQKVACGDIVLSFPGDSFPADMMVLGAPEGQAFISTMNLDGETNLKERRPPTACSALAEVAGEKVDVAVKVSEGAELESPKAAVALAQQLALAQGLEIQFDKPSAPLAELGGAASFSTLTDESKQKLKEMNCEPLSNLSFENFVPRGCKLQQTPWLVSVVAYVGTETKVMLNTSAVDAKTSNLQVALNRSVLGLVSTLVLFCLYSATLGQAVGTDDTVDEFFTKFIQYWIILYQIVPVSLYVVFEMVKLLLGNAINNDPAMIDPKTGVHAVARTSDLVEELGQVEHVFSDKTGTLTQNEMVFARCYIGQRDLGEFRPVEGQAVPPGVAEARKILLASGDNLHEDVKSFFVALALCHDAQVDIKDNKEPEYSGSSADEVSFLEASHAVGVSMQARAAMPGSSGAILHIHMPGGAVEMAKVLCQLPFDSDRKRMTVVCEWHGTILCLSKGADSTMAPLCLGMEHHVHDQLTQFGKLGLRTLVIAQKTLELAEFEEWNKEYEAARSAGGAERERLMTACAAKLEHGLDFLGLTAIEDKLQDGVPEAIQKLNEMNVHVWMLTGDKTETAIEIAKSCNLVDAETSLVKLAGATSEEMAFSMLKAARDTIQNAKPAAIPALVLDGAFVLHVFRMAEGNSGSEEAEAKQILCSVAMGAKACICCRLSPQQKRNLVEMVKFAGKGRISLAIGDGANDVAMIQGAHCGVAVRGKEGTQAVQASDVAISQFRFLVPLLQCHGRRAYRRVSLYLCYFIYKHVALAVGDMLWAHQDSFQGRIAYPDWLSAGYPVVYTALPIIILVMYDLDLPDQVAIDSPHLYLEGQERIYFNWRVFGAWIASGIWHGSIAWLLPSLVVDNGSRDGEEDPDFWTASLVSFTLVVAHVSLRLWLVSMNKANKYVIGVLVLCFAVYFISVLILGHTALGVYMQPQLDGIPLDLFTRLKAVLAMLLTPFALLLDALVFKLLHMYRPTALYLARQKYQSEGGSQTKGSQVSPEVISKVEEKN